jgi:hypothetical protein
MQVQGIKQYRLFFTDEAIRPHLSAHRGPTLSHQRTPLGDVLHTRFSTSLTPDYVELLSEPSHTHGMH